MKLKEILLDKKDKIELLVAEEIAKIEAKKIADIGEVDSMISILEVDLKESEDNGYDMGQKDAGVPSDSKKYTEEDLQKEKELAVAPFLAKVASLEASVAALQAEKEKIPEMIKAAIAEKVAEIVSDFEKTQLDDAEFLAKYKKV